jgi:methyl-accepting chemotaxis protein
MQFTKKYKKSKNSKNSKYNKYNKTEKQSYLHGGSGGANANTPQNNGVINKINNASNSLNRRVDRFNSRINNTADMFTNRINSVAQNITNTTGAFGAVLDNAFSQEPVQNFLSMYNPNPIVPDDGILDIAGKLALNSIFGPPIIVGKILLRLLGFEYIGLDPFSLFNELSQRQDIASRIATKVFNIADDRFGCIISTLNRFLGSPETRNSISGSSKQLINIFNTLLKDFIETLDDPMLKEEFVVAVFIIGEYVKIFSIAMKEPLDDAIDLLNDGIIEALTGVASGIVKVISDSMGAVPFIGPFVDIGRAINDGSKAAFSVFNAGVTAVEAASQLIGQTSENIESQLQELKEQGQNISNRINNSVNNFEQPLQNVATNIENTASNVGNTVSNVGNQMSVPYNMPVYNQNGQRISGGTKLKLNSKKTKSNKYKI